MEDMENLYDKLRTIKNQVFISLKALSKHHKENLSILMKICLDKYYESLKQVRKRLKFVF
jgi:hypothetical protein